MSNIIKTTLALALLASSSAMAESFSVVEYVTVTKSVPHYSAIQEQVPTQRCVDVQEPVNSPIVSNDTLGALVGGALGGVVGNQFGGGSGKTAATIGGAVLGSLAGQKIANSNGGSNTAPSYQVVRKCETVNNYTTRQVLSGYMNYAKLKGKEIVVETDQAVKQIPVTITYSY